MVNYKVFFMWPGSGAGELGVIVLPVHDYLYGVLTDYLDWPEAYTSYIPKLTGVGA